MTSNLVDLLIDTGLLQFGSFKENGFTIPFKLCLNMLPAYPDLLMQIVQETLPYLSEFPVQRLVSTADAIPFGVALSLSTQIPLVHSRGTNEPPVFDFVGAYDTGQSAILLLNTLDNFEILLPLIGNARQVGLEIQQVVSIIDLDLISKPSNLSVIPILNVHDILHDLSQKGHLPTGQMAVITDWVDNTRRRAGTLL